MPSREEIIAALTAAGPFELAHFTMAENESPGHPVRVYRHAPASFRAVFEGTKAHGEKLFSIYEDETLTYDQHYAQVAALAHHLVERGVAKGDRVAIGMRNYPEWSVAFWACQSIGAIVVALNAWWTSSELTYALDDRRPPP